MKGPRAGLVDSWRRSLDPSLPPPLARPPWGSQHTRAPAEMHRRQGMERQAPDHSVTRSPSYSCCRPEEAGSESCSTALHQAGTPHALALYIYPECFWLLPHPAKGSLHILPSATAGTGEVENKTTMSHTHLHLHRLYLLLNGTYFATYKQGINGY